MSLFFKGEIAGGIGVGGGSEEQDCEIAAQLVRCLEKWISQEKESQK